MQEQIISLMQKRYYTDEDVLALGKEAIPHLIELFNQATGEVAESERLSIISMLGVLDGEPSINFLIQVYQEMEGVNETLQMACVNALAHTDRESALAVVLPLLTSDNKRLRKNAIVSLSNTRRPDVLALIRQLSQSEPDESIRGHAQAAVERIENRLA